MEGGDINHETVLHVALQHTLIRLVDVLDVNLFHLGHHVVLATEVEHLLRLGEAGNVGTANKVTAGDDVLGLKRRVGVLGHTDEVDLAINVEGVDVGLKIVAHADGVNDEIEGTSCGLHLLRVGGLHHAVGAELLGSAKLLGAGGEHGHLRLHGMGQLDGHVAETTEAHHTNTGALLHAPVAEGGEGGGTGAQQGGSGAEVEVVGDAADEALAHNDVVGVATIGGGGLILLGGVVGEGGALHAVLLHVTLALLALAAGVHHAADSHGVANLVLGDLGADLGDVTDDLVAGDHGEDTLAPLVTDLVEVAVADATEGHLDGHVILTDITTLDGVRGEGHLACRRGISLAFSGH
ncbi:alcohol dehydrogenase (NADP+) [Angomonas deanei]|nr:alcohol dehydrogenase (NADP+) [Angomonas deanei]|eukprot:EPY40649.1 alcohol dehydrogenase (NADP+) [Angomonas deanei]